MKIFITFFILLISTSTFAKPLDEKHVLMLLWRGITDAEKGYISYLSERNQVRFTILNANRDKKILQQYVDNISQYNADLIYTFGTTVTRTLLGTIEAPTTFRQQSTIPVVFSIVADPVGSHLLSESDIESRNFTGVSHIVPHEVQLRAISQLDNIKTVGIIFNPLENNSVVTATKISLVSAQFDIQIKQYPLKTKQGKPDSSSVKSIADQMKKDNIDLVYLPSDSYIISRGDAIIETFHQLDIPTFSASESPIRNSGALLGIVSRYYNVGQFAGYKSEQILNGSTPIQEIAIEALSQYSYIVNINAAKQLDYYPPISILKISEIIGKH